MKCEVCGNEFPPTINTHYISRDASRTGLSVIVNKDEPTLYDTFDCSVCGCQVIVKERKRVYIDTLEDDKDQEEVEEAEEEDTEEFRCYSCANGLASTDICEDCHYGNKYSPIEEECAEDCGTEQEVIVRECATCGHFHEISDDDMMPGSPECIDCQDTSNYILSQREDNTIEKKIKKEESKVNKCYNCSYYGVEDEDGCVTENPICEDCYGDCIPPL